MKTHTYFIESFGCQMNQSDSERIAGQLESMGYVHCDQHGSADIIVINTCCVRESAESRIWGHIGALKHIKEHNPDTLIIIAGCMAQKDQQLIFRRAPATRPRPCPCRLSRCPPSRCRPRPCRRR